MDKEDIKRTVAPLLQKYGVAKASIFGSFVKGQQHEGSDIDMLIEFNDSDKKSLLDLIALEQDMEELIQRKVDLVTASSIHPAIKPSVLKEMETFYGPRS